MFVDDIVLLSVVGLQKKLDSRHVGYIVLNLKVKHRERETYYNTEQLIYNGNII